MSFMQQFSATIIADQKSQMIVVELHTDKCRKSKVKFNNNMLQLLLVGGIVDFLSPGTFIKPCIPNYTQAMKNILLQPILIQAISTVNILTTVFNEMPEEMAKRLSPLTTHKSMHHISKNFASALLSCNFQQTNLNSLSYEMNFIFLALLSRVILEESTHFASQSKLQKMNVNLISLYLIAKR